MARPEPLGIATLLTDRLLGALSSLHRYDYVVDGAGHIWPVGHLHQIVCDAVCAEFKRITGQAYKPTTLRTVEFRDAQETK